MARIFRWLWATVSELIWREISGDNFPDLLVTQSRLQWHAFSAPSSTFYRNVETRLTKCGKTFHPHPPPRRYVTSVAWIDSEGTHPSIQQTTTVIKRELVHLKFINFLNDNPRLLIENVMEENGHASGLKWKVNLEFKRRKLPERSEMSWINFPVAFIDSEAVNTASQRSHLNLQAGRQRGGRLRRQIAVNGWWQIVVLRQNSAENMKLPLGKKSVAGAVWMLMI